MTRARSAPRTTRSKAPLKASRRDRCARCDDETSHCHGVLLEHRDGTLECTDDVSCDAAEERHEDIERCTEHDPACRCEV